jgi:drug/metabolite transporter (DMT)-like permease
MWFVFALLTFTFWGVADIYYKKSNTQDEENSHYKTGMAVGFIMGIHATIYLLIKHTSINYLDIIKYLPISLCYITSMIIGYKGLKYLELSISSPIQNSSGIITSFLLILIFHIMPTKLEILGILFITIGILLVSFLEKRKTKVYKFSFMITFFPMMYAILDGIGTFLDGIYLDNLSIISEDAALISYEYTFLIYAIILFIIFKFKKKQKITLSNEKNRLIAAILETLGQFFYVYAISSHSYITIPIIASYGTLSVLLSRVILKEKITTKQYISIILIIIGIIILGLSEGLT